MSLNKYFLKVAINKKWPENQSNPEEDKYESPTLVYCKETNTMVALAKTCFQTPLRIQGSWNDDNAETLEIMVESSKGVDSELGPSVEGFPQYYHR